MEVGETEAKGVCRLGAVVSVAVECLGAQGPRYRPPLGRSLPTLPLPGPPSALHPQAAWDPSPSPGPGARCLTPLQRPWHGLPRAQLVPRYCVHTNKALLATPDSSSATLGPPPPPGHRPRHSSRLLAQLRYPKLQRLLPSAQPAKPHLRGRLPGKPPSTPRLPLHSPRRWTRADPLPLLGPGSGLTPESPNLCPDRGI